MKILVANLGSTSFKYRLFDMTDERQWRTAASNESAPEKSVLRADRRPSGIDRPTCQITPWRCASAWSS